MLPLRAGRLEDALLPRRRVRPRRRGLARRADVPREHPRAPALSRKHHGAAQAERVRRLLRAGPAAARRGRSGASAGGCTATRRAGSRPGSSALLIRSWLAVPLAAARRSRRRSCSRPGAVVARALGVRSACGDARLGARGRLRRAGASIFAVARVADVGARPAARRGVVALPFARRAPRGRARRRADGGCWAPAPCSGSCSGTSRARSAATASSTWRASGSSSVRLALARRGERVRGRRAAPGLRVPALAGVPRARREGRASSIPSQVVLHEATVLAPLALLVAVRGRVRAVPARRPGGRRRLRAGRRSPRSRRATAAPTRRSACRRRRPGSCSSRRRSRSRWPPSRDPSRRLLARSAAAGLVARRRPSDLRDLPLAAVRRLRSSCARSSARRGGASGSRPRWPRSSSPPPPSSRGCCRWCGRRPRCSRTRASSQRALRQYAGQLRRLLRYELLARARGLRAERRRRRRGASLRPARRARARGGAGPRTCSAARSRSLAVLLVPLALRALLRRRLALAVAARGRLLAVRVRLRGRARRPRGPAAGGRRPAGARRGHRAPARSTRATSATAPGRRAGARDLDRPRRRRGARWLSGCSCAAPALPGGPRCARCRGRARSSCCRSPARGVELEPVRDADAEPADAGARRGAARAGARGRRRLLRSRVELSHRGLRAGLRRRRAAGARGRHGAEPPVRAARGQHRVLRRPATSRFRAARRRVARASTATASTLEPELDEVYRDEPLHALPAHRRAVAAKYHRRA